MVGSAIAPNHKASLSTLPLPRDVHVQVLLVLGQNFSTKSSTSIICAVESRGDKSNSIAEQEDNQEQQFIQPQRGSYVSIIDAALVESGMANDWLDASSIDNYVWAESQGRRPMIYHQKVFQQTAKSPTNLIVATGRIVDLIEGELTIDSADKFVEIFLQHDIGKVTVRASLDPKLQPKLQGSFDHVPCYRLRVSRHGSREAFLLRNPKGENYLLCVKN